MKPAMPKGLDEVDAAYQSIHGKIESHWKKAGDRFQWQVMVPVNTTALVYVPAVSVEQVTENGAAAKDAEGLQFLRMENGYAVFEAGSGIYQFASSLK